MPSDHPRELRPYGRVLDNQRPSLRERSKKKVSAQERREGNSSAHLALIRKMPCCTCLMVHERNDPHHLKSELAGAERGVGMKATDKWTVPLCRRCHDEVESIGSRKEVGFFEWYGISDVHELAHALWKETGDLGRMIKILMAHRGGKK